jgi:O-antigen ligase
MSVKELPAGTLFIELNEPVKEGTRSAQTNRLLREKIIADLQDEARKSGKTLTATEASQMASTISAGLKPVNTVVSDISMATRIQVEWPRAIQAFLSYPIFGKGPSTITEATDNDFLRWLGEFGIVGTLIFLFMLFSFIRFIYSQRKKYGKDQEYIFLGYLAGLFGLLIYASYFDVFEASKVAYTFWSTTAIIIGYLTLTSSKKV